MNKKGMIILILSVLLVTCLLCTGVIFILMGLGAFGIEEAQGNARDVYRKSVVSDIQLSNAEAEIQMGEVELISIEVSGDDIILNYDNGRSVTVQVKVIDLEDFKLSVSSNTMDCNIPSQIDEVNICFEVGTDTIYVALEDRGPHSAELF